MLLNTLEGPTDSVIAVAWNPDGTLLAAGSYDETVRIWDIATGNTLHILDGHQGGARYIRWNANGRWLAVARPVMPT